MRNSIIWCFLILLVLSCSDDTGVNGDLDNQLNELLVQASETGSKDFFIMPDSDDLSAIPQDPNNPLTAVKVELGKLLFHETAFGRAGEFEVAVGTYSCASCHHATAGFQSGLRQGIGEGGMGFGHSGESRVKNPLCEDELVDVQPIRTPTAMNSAYQELMLWNGQFGAVGLNVGTESQWTAGTPKENNNLGFHGLETQAIAGQGVHRQIINRDLVVENGYKDLFDQAFPEVSEQDRYSEITGGLAMAAYERTLLSNQAPFQKYLRGNQEALSDYEKEGAILFFGKGKCATCHTGPALSSMTFHALGMDDFDKEDVFFLKENSTEPLGRYSFTQREADKYAFKTPQLYNLADVSFYGHGASFSNIVDVIKYKNQAIPQKQEVTPYLASGFHALDLSLEEVYKIAAFIREGLYDDQLSRYVPVSLPSGACFPNNDDQSRLDLGCN